MAIEALEQREVKVEDGAISAGEGLGAATSEGEALDARPKKMYLLRVPKPPSDDTELKKLQEEFQGHVAKLKSMNAKLAVKRVSRAI